MSNKIIIAIDGYSSCGKSTLAKALAAKLEYVFIDTGAMYRAVALYFLRNRISFNDELAIAAALNNITLNFIYLDYLANHEEPLLKENKRLRVLIGVS